MAASSAQGSLSAVVPDVRAIWRWGLRVAVLELPADDWSARLFGITCADANCRILDSREAAKDEVFDAGSAVTIKVDDSKFAGWTKQDLYDGATKVGEMTKGKAEFTVKDLKAGYHAFSVLGTDGEGMTCPSNPVLVVVRSKP